MYNNPAAVAYLAQEVTVMLLKCFYSEPICLV